MNLFFIVDPFQSEQIKNLKNLCVREYRLTLNLTFSVLSLCLLDSLFYGVTGFKGAFQH